jgi:hypothetical protein
MARKNLKSITDKLSVIYIFEKFIEISTIIRKFKKLEEFDITEHGKKYLERKSHVAKFIANLE